MASQLINKVAIVTGASSGIGRSTALQLASLGCCLSLSGRNKQNLSDVKKKCSEKLQENQVLIVDGDIGEESTRERLIQETLKFFGKIDILINNAGIIKKGTVETTSLADFDEVMNINVRSCYHLMQLAIPHLKLTKGNIVNVSSVNGLRSFAGVAVYNTSKASLDHLTRCAALELAPDGVRVNAVNPGVIVTEIHKRGGMNDQEYQAFLERSKTTHPLGRPGNPEEVAKAIQFLADDSQSSFITGVTLSVDGGRHLTCLR